MKCLKCIHPVESGKDKYGLHPACYTEWFSAELDDEFYDIVRRSSVTQAPLSEEQESSESWNSSFFQGKFQKYSGRLAGKNYILKVEQDLAPELPNVEMVCNQIADNVGLEVPSYFLINILKKRTFVTGNFITEIRGAVSLNHIYHYIKDATEYNCEKIIRAIEGQTRNFPDVEMFVKTCLYDAFVGNHDRHGRNLGFLVKGDSTCLAPIYDNTSVLGLEQGEFLKMQFEPRGKIATQKTYDPVGVDYVREFIRLGYRDTVERFLSKIVIADIEVFVDKSFCSKLMKSALRQLISRRYREMKDAL